MLQLRQRTLTRSTVERLPFRRFEELGLSCLPTEDILDATDLFTKNTRTVRHHHNNNSNRSNRLTAPTCLLTSELPKHRAREATSLIHRRHHHIDPTTASTNMVMELDNKKQTILHINASITHDSVTARVATAMIDHVTHHYHRHVENGTCKPQAPEDVLNIEELDVWSDQLPKFDRETMQKVWRARNNSQDEADIAAFKPIQDLAAQMLRADFLMITVPVWNFSVPYVVKQYIDCIVQPGLTFKNADASGPSGPFFKGRPLIIISSSGGKAPPPHEDFVVPFLTKIFAMCGFDDAHHVAIQGLATHDKQECYENAVKEANAIADQVVQNHKLRLEANEVDTTSA